MNNPQCISSAQEIGKFVCATGGNWRSSIYIECSECKFNHSGSGMNFLLAFDAEGRPQLLPEHDAQIIFGRLIDKSEDPGRTAQEHSSGRPWRSFTWRTDAAF